MAMAQQGWKANNKRIRRLWREEVCGCRKSGTAKKRLTGISVAVGAMSPIPTECDPGVDFQFDTTANGRTPQRCSTIDEFTREALAIEVDRSIDAAVSSTSWTVWRSRMGRRTMCVSTNGLEFVRMPPCRIGAIQQCRFTFHRSRLAVAEHLDRIIQSVSRLRDELFNLMAL